MHGVCSCISFRSVESTEYSMEDKGNSKICETADAWSLLLHLCLYRFLNGAKSTKIMRVINICVLCFFLSPLFAGNLSGSRDSLEEHNRFTQAENIIFPSNINYL